MKLIVVFPTSEHELQIPLKKFCELLGLDLKEAQEKLEIVAKQKLAGA